MATSETFRAGQRIRIRSGADSDFAGHYGVIMHVGSDVCDVKIRYKPKGTKVKSTYIGTFAKSDLESLRGPVNHATYSPERTHAANRSMLGWLSMLAVVVGVAVVWLIVRCCVR